MSTDKYYLDIGGTPFTTTRATLSRIPYFATYFRNWAKDHVNDSLNPHFVDQDGEGFRHILNWARNPTRAVPAEVDVSFWDPSGSMIVTTPTIPPPSSSLNKQNSHATAYTTMKESRIARCVKCKHFVKLDNPTVCHHFNSLGVSISERAVSYGDAVPKDTCFFCGKGTTFLNRSAGDGRHRVELWGVSGHCTHLFGEGE